MWNSHFNIQLLAKNANQPTKATKGSVTPKQKDNTNVATNTAKPKDNKTSEENTKKTTEAKKPPANQTTATPAKKLGESSTQMPEISPEQLMGLLSSINNKSDLSRLKELGVDQKLIDLLSEDDIFGFFIELREIMMTMQTESDSAKMMEFIKQNSRIATKIILSVVHLYKDRFKEALESQGAQRDQLIESIKMQFKGLFAPEEIDFLTETIENPDNIDDIIRRFNIN